MPDGGISPVSARFTWSQLRPEFASYSQLPLIQTRRLPEHAFGDLDVLIDLTDQEVHLTFVKGRC